VNIKERVMALPIVSKIGKGKTLYIELSIYPCGKADPTRNLTISCPDKDSQFKTTVSDEGLQKFKEKILEFYQKHVLDPRQEP
jgi:hypothetical protein